jgi:hypothetical protein
MTAIAFASHACAAMIALVVGFVIGTYDRSDAARLCRDQLRKARLDALDYRQAAERAELARAEAEARLELLKMGTERHG